MTSNRPLFRLRLMFLIPVVGPLLLSAHCAGAEDWPQFRGPGGQGKSPATALPLTWSDTENIEWKTPLPGPGTSSPVVFGDRVFLTCYTGGGGDLGDLKRHLLCLKLADGSLVWNTAVAAALPEQEKIREDHGYASSTPAVDADRIYAFFGRSGVFAFDHQGRQLWQADVGSGLNGWGSASSPVLHDGLLLVNASVESEAVVALDVKTGREVWRAGGIKESWHTPVVATHGGTSELVIAMLQKIMGLNPATGEKLWECDSGIQWYMCPSPVVDGDTVFLIGGRGGQGLAIRLGGRGDVTDSHVVWKLTKGANVPSPIHHDGHLYFVSDTLAIAYCADAKTGEVVYAERLSPDPEQIYASPVLAEGRLYYLGRGGRSVVVAAKPTFETLGSATLENGRGLFNASPAPVGNRLLLRSDRALYSIKAAP